VRREHTLRIGEYTAMGGIYAVYHAFFDNRGSGGGAFSIAEV
jgi:hypothetical protein